MFVTTNTNFNQRRKYFLQLIAQIYRDIGIFPTSLIKITICFLLFFLSSSVFSKSLFCVDFILPNSVNSSCIIIRYENNSIKEKFNLDKKYFKLGKKIFRNPFFKSPKHTLKDKVSTVVITLLTGPLGGHRLYLGTKPIVPVVYAITLGGGIGILPFIDMIAVIVTKDLNQYIDNDKIIMWIK